MEGSFASRYCHLAKATNKIVGREEGDRASAEKALSSRRRRGKLERKSSSHRRPSPLTAPRRAAPSAKLFSPFIGCEGAIVCGGAGSGAERSGGW